MIIMNLLMAAFIVWVDFVPPGFPVEGGEVINVEVAK